MFDCFKWDWKSKIDAEQSTRPNQRNKLRTSRQFKHEYCTEPYVTEALNRQYHIALATFRCGLAPLRIETGRYERLPREERLCFNCANKVEVELHVLTECPLYGDIRHGLYQKAATCSDNCLSLSDNEKLIFILSNSAMVKSSAKTCHEILSRRRNLIFSSRQ